MLREFTITEPALQYTWEGVAAPNAEEKHVQHVNKKAIRQKQKL